MMTDFEKSTLHGAINQLEMLRNGLDCSMTYGPDQKERNDASQTVYDLDCAIARINRVLTRQPC